MEFKDFLHEHLKNKVDSDFKNQSENLKSFLIDLTTTFGFDYSTFDPFVNGNYAVFMEHGTWFKTLMKYYQDGTAPKTVQKYISFMDYTKTDINKVLYSPNDKTINKLKFSQLITDISIPETNKEYMPISTRQKNSFVNTRDYVGSDFSMTFLDTIDLNIAKYMEAWNKSIDLIREGLFFTYESNKEYFDRLQEETYLIDNHYNNTVWVAILDSKGVELKGLIALFGVLPINTSLKNIIGDRGSPKLTTYNLNFKFMDMQYEFIDGWDNLKKQSDISESLGKKFFSFLAYDDNLGKLQ